MTSAAASPIKVLGSIAIALLWLVSMQVFRVESAPWQLLPWQSDNTTTIDDSDPQQDSRLEIIEEMRSHPVPLFSPKLSSLGLYNRYFGTTTILLYAR